jgi:D-inositol-3-phosphate glycosyltransferase
MTVVRSGETGYLVSRCPGFFAERLDFLLDHPGVLEEMRMAARESVVQFSWQSVGEQMRAVYEELCADVDEKQAVAAR